MEPGTVVPIFFDLFHGMTADEPPYAAMVHRDLPIISQVGRGAVVSRTRYWNQHGVPSITSPRLSFLGVSRALSADHTESTGETAELVLFRHPHPNVYVAPQDIQVFAKGCFQKHA